MFNYNWTLKDAVFTKDKGKVFSCFSCGGGSTMGYKLAGFDVIGCNEIDPKLMNIYIDNHKPKFSFLESISTFKDRNDLPKELYNLDILDGSPPCSSFSMAGNREKDWGKSKKFREGQTYQILDTLFFDFIDLAEKLQPKIVVAENVKGILLGRAFEYTKEIHKAFDKAGYYCQHYLLDASKMGVPQKRERVFFICIRKDIATPVLRQVDMFKYEPQLQLSFNEDEIPFKDIEATEAETEIFPPSPCFKKYWEMCSPGESTAKHHPKGYFFGSYKIDKMQPLNTILAGYSKSRCGALHYEKYRLLKRSEIYKASTFPLDYECKDPFYICGMSVPPVMVARIATEIYKQWLSKVSKNF